MKRKILNILLVFSMLIGCFAYAQSNAKEVYAAVDVGNNPTPVIDIAVNVPSDYPGTFLDFKKELTQKLVDQGMDPSTFRITSTAVSIDTTSMDGWHVYDHYHTKSGGYDSLVPADQRGLQPYRNAGTSSMDAPANANILNYINKVTNKFINTACIQFNRHIGIYQSDTGASNMAFAGYGKPAYSDYMIYPAPSSTTRTFSFNIDASVINTHTLTAFGFWMNAGITAGSSTPTASDDMVSGYLLYFNASSAASGTGNVVIKKVNNVAADSLTSTFTGGTDMSGSAKSFSLGTQKKVRLTVELKKDSLTIQQQAYDANGNLSDPVDVLRNFAIPQFASSGTLNGLGPWVGYSSHGCNAFSAIIYTDLEMSYEASAFDALKYVQYYQGAEWKYFINLVGDSGNPNVPKDTTKDFNDGINQMTQDEIFYISNVQDGQIVRDNVKDENGKVISQGLGASNGIIATQDDYASQMAEYIAKNYFEKNHFVPQEIVSEIPLANFHVVNKADGKQLMTLHLQHLVKTNETVSVNIVDKSMPASSGAKIVKYYCKLYDPNGTEIFNGTYDDIKKVPNYTFTKNSISGTYVFELTVEDDDGEKSKTFQTYLTAYLDNKEPYIEAENSEKNKFKVVFTDTGEGIDEDGITFVSDNRGSGVAAYWITNSTTLTPEETDWEYFGELNHTQEINVPITSTDPIVVWVKDECGNIGNKAVFQPTHVRVEDPDGNPIDDYYVIGDKPIIVLPPDEDVPPSDDDDDYFSGWETPDKDPVTPGTTPDPDDNHEIIIRPNYSKDQAVLVYKANGGTIEKGEETFYVTAGASILQKVGDQDVVPEREGYTFTGWKLLKSHDANNANNSSYINNAANVEVISDQKASASANQGKQENFVADDYYYLIAQYDISKYTLRFDANGGSLGNVRSFENVEYQQSIIATDISDDTGVQAIPVTGRGIPTKPGYIFQGWSTTRDASGMFKPVSGTAKDVKMPASDMTVYAIWAEDPARFVISFDTDGGNTIKDIAFNKTANNVYPEAPTPTKPGYDFVEWRLLDGNNITSSKYPAVGTNITNNNDHGFRAIWTPRNDTKYTIEYWYNTGEKTPTGSFIYRKVSDMGATHTGTTGANVTLPNENKLPELEIDGTKYWFNEANTSNVLSGEITGSPALALKLYYDRYLNVRVITKGNGTGNSLENVKEGTNPVASWTPATGYHVTRVLVDGTVRDDLINEGGIEFTNISGNHTVYVEFGIGSTPSEPTNPDDTPKQYSVETYFEGCTDGTCSITPTTRVNAGENVTVNWTVSSGYRVTSITVDGIDYPNISETSMDFNSIASNHVIVVKVEKLPTIGGDHTDGYYTVTVNKYGGDGSLVVSPSKVVNKGDNYEVLWDVENDNYQVYKVLVDGKEITLRSKDVDGATKGFNLLKNMHGNHVVDIYYAEKPKEGEDIKEPIFNEESVKVDTQVVGGPGTITGGAIIEKGSEYDVEWELPTWVDPDSDDYKYYEITSVTVNGKEVEISEDNKVDLGKVNEDTRVVVEVKPVLYDVATQKYGDGSISVSKTLYKGQSYIDIKAQPNAGSYLVKLVVDGEEVEVSGADKLQVQVPVEPTPEPTDETENNNVSSPENSEESDTNNEVSNDIEIIETPEISEPQVSESTEELNEETSESSLFNNLFGAFRIVAEETPEVSLGTADTSGFTMAITNISNDHEITAYFAKQAVDPETGDPITTPDPDNPTGPEIPVIIDINDKELWNVTATIKDIKDDSVKVPSNVEGNGIFEDGESTTIKWNGIPSNYKIVKVEIDGNPVTFIGSELPLDNIDSDKNVVIYVQKEVTNDKDVPVDKEFHEDPYTISTAIKGATGTITSGGSVMAGNDYKVDWKVTPEAGHDYKVKDVIIDGVSRPDLVGKSTFTFKDVQANHSIVVVIGDVFKTNIDIPYPDPDSPDPDNPNYIYDGKPDLNIDTDGDGFPDVNIDIDGDGYPDINIDTDNTGIWKPSNEGGNADGIWKPDTNIDKGDGRGPVSSDRSKPVDEDGNGVDDRWKPDKNIYPNGEANPGYDTVYIKPNTPSTGDPVSDYSPNTGDDSMTPWMMLGMITSLTAYFVVKKRRNYKVQ